MTDTLISRPGDTLDELVWRERRLGAAALARVLDANPAIADPDAVLPAGTRVALPAEDGGG